MKQALRVAFSFLILWASVLYAEVRIVIDSGVDSGHPIGTVPFQWVGPGAASEDIGGIIAADLRNSGKSDPLDRARLPQRSDSAQEIQPAARPVLGIDAVVAGQVTPNPGGSYNVAYQPVDTGGAPGIVLAQDSYRVDRQWLHYIDHTVSDEVFERLTGTKSVFHTHIAYVAQANGGQFPYELRVSDHDGYNRSIIHRSPQPLIPPAWSPDGFKLAYVTFESGYSALVIQTLANGTIRQVASLPRHNGAPVSPPDDSKLAFTLSKTGSLNLRVMDLASGQIRQATDGRSNDTEPAWSPDSQNLALTSDQASHLQIYKMGINGDAP